MHGNAVTLNKFLQGHLRMQLADLPDDQLAAQPVPETNHPLWTVGHLAFSGDSCVGLLGGEKTLPEDWKTLFGMGSRPTSRREDYPPLAELLAACEDRYARLSDLASAITPEQWDGPNPHPRLKERLPTLGDLVSFVLTAHFAVHVGQLSMWRRTIGLGPLF